MSNLLSSLLPISIAAGLTLLCVGEAHAWNVKTTESGQAIRWPDGEVAVDIVMQPNHGISSEIAEREIKSAMLNWTAAGDSLEVVFNEPDETRMKSGKDGFNVVRWVTDAEDSFLSPEALGTTYLTYRTTSGKVTEADIVINSVNYDWIVLDSDPCQLRYDLQNIVSHEAGHFFGIAHSEDHKESTMYPTAKSCETSKRALDDDDIQAYYHLYETLDLVDDTPENPLDVVGCSATGGSGGLWTGLLVLLGIFSVTRRTSLRRWMALALFAPLVSFSGDSQASTVEYLDAATLDARSGQVVEGTVVSQTTTLVRGWPMTVSTVAVSNCRDADCSPHITVSQLGGEVGEVGLHVEGVKALQMGQRYLLFLRYQNGVNMPVGMAQGIFAIQETNGVEVFTRDLRDISLVSANNQQVLRLQTMTRQDFAAEFASFATLPAKKLQTSPAPITDR